jgi:CDP-diacylglycerol--serine O-phosphatidyltransferase
MGALRYVVPNAITSLGVVCGLMSLVSTARGEYAAAGYFVIWAVLLDNLDGPVARALKATSEFGAQMDSFADFFNFGVAPAFLVHVSLARVDALGFSDGPGYALLSVAAAGWVLSTMFRLARFNVTAPTKGMLFGVPTTLAAGVLTIWYLALLKYSPSGTPLAPGEFFGEPRALGSANLPLRVWGWFPAAMMVGAVLMASSLPMPKLGGLVRPVVKVGVLLGVVIGYVCNALRIFPELMVWLPTGWLVWFLAWGQLSPRARGMRPARMFPR